MMGCDPSGNGLTGRYIQEETHMEANATKDLKFESIEQAERVLRPYKIVDRLKNLVLEGFDIHIFTQREIAQFIGASRERTNRAMATL